MNRRNLLRGVFAAPVLVFGRPSSSATCVPATMHAGEIILTPAQLAEVNASCLSAKQVFSVIQRSQKDFARQIGPIFSDWQRRFA